MKKIFFILLIMFINSYLYAYYCPLCKKNYPDKFVYCPKHGIKLEKIKVKTAKKDWNKTSKNKFKSFLKVQQEKKSIIKSLNIENQNNILLNMKNDKYTIPTLVNFVKANYDKKNQFVLTVLQYLYKKKSKNIEILKLYAGFLYDIKDYKKSTKIYNELDKIISKKISELIK